MSFNRSIKSEKSIYITEAILDQLKVPMSCPELANRLNINARDCRYYVQYLRETKKIHVSGWENKSTDKNPHKCDVYSLGEPKEIEIEKLKIVAKRNCFVKVPQGKRQAHCDISASWIPRK